MNNPYGWCRLYMTLMNTERAFFRRHPRAEMPASVGALTLLAIGAAVLCWVIG